MKPENQHGRSLWFGTAGLGYGFGGVAHVARTTLEALGKSGSPFCIRRVISLLDPKGKHPPIPLPTEAKWSACRGSRSKFLRHILSQAVSRPDFVLYDHMDLAQCHVLLPRGLRAPFGIWVHGVEVWKPLPPRKLRALREADVLLVNSYFTKSKLEEFHGVFPRAMVVPLTYGGDVADASNRKEPWILTVGRLEPGRPKGHREILAALPGIVAAVPHFHWHVAGTGSALEAFKRDVADSEMRKYVTVHGFVETPALEALSHRSQVFCMPSEGEGFGVVYLEAMRHGCIPVGSLLDAAREVIGDGGVCTDHTNPEALATTLIRLLSLPSEEAQQWSAQARRRAAEFGPVAFHERLCSALGRVFKGGWEPGSGKDQP